ncbi:hypothetical protein FBY14_1245 [Azospirillum brasilense]|nr:hypothetical protein FBY14_1245 [Azospirillum brasilense]
MSFHKLVVVTTTFILVSGHALAQDGDSQSVAGGRNPALEWAKQAEVDQYAFKVAADRDAELKRWCETGFGPINRCMAMQLPSGKGAAMATTGAPTPATASAPPPAASTQTVVHREADDAPREVQAPTVREVTVWGKSETAALVFPDGSEQRVKKGDTLSDASKATVVAVSVRHGVQVRTETGSVVTLRNRRAGNGQALRTPAPVQRAPYAMARPSSSLLASPPR